MRASHTLTEPDEAVVAGSRAELDAAAELSARSVESGDRLVESGDRLVESGDRLVELVETTPAAGFATPSVAVLDYGSGNLHSVSRALEAAGAKVVLTADADTCLAADGLLVPGVGAFAACMDGLAAVGGPQLILRRLAAKRAVLGICVGHQVLFALGVEHGDPAPGVGVLPGVVERLDAVPLPHMGWNTVQPPIASAMFAGVEGERFYFVHSYGVHEVPDWPQNARITWAEHGGDRFIAAVEQGPLWSTQFHPEKSGDAGARLLRNWLDTLRRES